MILLDTHVLNWFAEDNRSLGRRTVRLTDAALHRDEVAVSAVSFWEIAMLVEKKRLRIDRGPTAMRREVLERGVREVDLTGSMGIAAAQLAGFHGDPVDRMIVATALSLDATLVSADDPILGWRGSLKRQDARR